MGKYDITIGIVSWNVEDRIKECIESLYNFKGDLNIQIIVFDNASSDNTVKMLKENFKTVILIPNDVNIGFARANNEIFKLCKGKYFLILNPDIILIEDCLQKMIAILESDKDIGLIGCKLIDPFNRIQKSYYTVFPSIFSELKLSIGLHKLRLSNKSNSSKNTSLVEVAYLVGACMLIKSDYYQRIGGFNNNYFMYSEDVDLCFRLRNFGLKIIYLSDVKMIHHHASSSCQQTQKFFAAIVQKESRYKYFLFNFGKFKANTYKFIWLISSLIRCVFFVIAYFLIAIKFIDVTERALIIDKLKRNFYIFLWSINRLNWIKTM